MDNAKVDEFILAQLPRTFMSLHMRADQHFGVETYRKVDARLQSLRKRGLITFDRIKGEGTVWRIATPSDGSNARLAAQALEDGHE